MKVHPDRRRFLGQFLGGVTAGALAPELLAGATGRSPLASLSRLATESSPGQEGEGYWRLVKEQFQLDPELTLMNAANLCPSPYPVQDAVFTLTRSVDRDASFQNRAQFGPLRASATEALARYLGADVDEIALVRNTSEGNNMVLNGIPLGPGDEVVIWDQNHPTNNISWDVKAERYGFEVRRVSTPRDPRASEDLIAPFLAAFTSRTRVVAFSHISNVSGMAIDAAELCRRAHDRGILALVDGAQAFGVVELDLHAMGCDFYTGSAHKWFVGPKEAGILYVRRDRIDDLWACNTGVGWEGALRSGAAKFENLGQRDDAAVAAMGTTVDFHESIGIRRVELRARNLVTALMEGLAERVPGIRFHTPARPELRAGVLVFGIEGREPRPIFEQLYAEDRIAGAGMGGDFAGVRFSPHLYNTMDEVERVVSAVARVVGV